jgi:hypothetical protein
MNFNNPFWPRHHFLFKSGGGNSQAQQIQSAPVPTPAPPVTANAAEVIQAENDFAKENLLKKSVKKTIFAGDTGGFMPGGGNMQGNAPGQPPASYKGKLG